MWRSSRQQLASSGPRGLDVSPRTSHAAENCERHKEIHLTSSVAADYTANLRCTLTSSTYPNHSWRVRRAFCVRAVNVRRELWKDPCWQHRAAPQPPLPPLAVSPSPASKSL